MWYNLLKYVQTKQFGGGVVYWHGKSKEKLKKKTLQQQIGTKKLIKSKYNYYYFFNQLNLFNFFVLFFFGADEVC